MDQRHRTPVFNPNAEAHAVQALNGVMMLFQTALRPIGPEELLELQHSLARLVDCLFPIEGNTADIAGFAPLPAGHYVHPIKTAEAAVLLGRSTGMPRSKLITLATAAALMNVGYVQLKQSLIDEPRKLMDGEWEQQMHTHPSHSVAALTASGLSHEAIAAIGQHHERWDGSGYPHGARGGEISIEARVLAIADTFIAVRSQRPHRPAMPAEQALHAIRDGAGQLFEPGGAIGVPSIEDAQRPTFGRGNEGSPALLGHLHDQRLGCRILGQQLRQGRYRRPRGVQGEGGGLHLFHCRLSIRGGILHGAQLALLDVGTFLGQHDINISFMRVGRTAVRGKALMAVGTDDPITPEAVEGLSAIPKILSARVVRFA